MPSMVMTEIFKNLPHLKTLHIQNVDTFTINECKVVMEHLLTYSGLEHLDLSLVVFNLDDIKDLM
jgi:hypothetical protein